MNQKIDSILLLYGINKTTDKDSYDFLSRLLLNYAEWPAYRSGVIDINGNILVPRKRMNSIQKKTFTKFDLIVLRMKKMMEKTSYGTMLNKIPVQTLASMILKESEVPTTVVAGIEKKDIPLSFMRRKKPKEKELINE